MRRNKKAGGPKRSLPLVGADIDFASAYYAVMMVPVSPRRPAAAFSRLVIRARPCG